MSYMIRNIVQKKFFPGEAFEKVNFWLKIAGGQEIPAAGGGMICLPREKIFEQCSLSYKT